MSLIQPEDELRKLLEAFAFCVEPLFAINGHNRIVFWNQLLQRLVPENDPIVPIDRKQRLHAERECLQQLVQLVFRLDQGHARPPTGSFVTCEMIQTSHRHTAQ